MYSPAGTCIRVTPPTTTRISCSTKISRYTWKRNRPSGNIQPVCWMSTLPTADAIPKLFHDDHQFPYAPRVRHKTYPVLVKTLIYTRGMFRNYNTQMIYHRDRSRTESVETITYFPLPAYVRTHCAGKVLHRSS